MRDFFSSSISGNHRELKKKFLAERFWTPVSLFWIYHFYFTASVFEEDGRVHVTIKLVFHFVEESYIVRIWGRMDGARGLFSTELQYHWNFLVYSPTEKFQIEIKTSLLN